MAELLALDGVTAGYGASVVLEDISLALDEGDSLALLGRNGVGKSTLLVTLMGLTRLHRGALRWRGRDLTALSTYQRAQAGIGWVPQERYMWPSLTIEEHLTAVARPGRWTLRRIYEIFPRLEERRTNLGNQLSGGEQQMLAIARALMVNPQPAAARRADGRARADHRAGPDEGDPQPRVAKAAWPSSSSSSMRSSRCRSPARRSCSIAGVSSIASASDDLANDPQTLHRLVAVA